MTTARPEAQRPSAPVTVLEIDTPQGPAKAHLHVAAEPKAGMVLGHGAAGGVTAPDLVAVTDVARSAGFSVALVEQPYAWPDGAHPLQPTGSTRPGWRSSSTCAAASCAACR